MKSCTHTFWPSSKDAGGLIEVKVTCNQMRDQSINTHASFLPPTYRLQRLAVVEDWSLRRLQEPADYLSDGKKKEDHAVAVEQKQMIQQASPFPSGANRTKNQSEFVKVAEKR